MANTPIGTMASPVARVGGPEHEAGEQGRPPPQDQHGPAVAMAEAQQAVVQVLLVGGGDVQAGRGHTADDGKGHVEQRHPEDHHGDEH